MYTPMIPRTIPNLDFLSKATSMPSGRDPISVRMNIPSVLVIPDAIVVSIVSNVIYMFLSMIFRILTAAIHISLR